MICIYWQVCYLSDYLDDISYSFGKTVQEMPATVTDCKMS